MACETQNKHFKVEVDGQACKACGYCIEVCPANVFARTAGFNGRGYRPVAAERAAGCIGCRRCFFACPDFAIDITALPAGEEHYEKDV